ncbi:MAG: hypothetical protein ABJJ43_06590 [Ekhidna sp.]
MKYKFPCIPAVTFIYVRRRRSTIDALYDRGSTFPLFVFLDDGAP